MMDKFLGLITYTIHIMQPNSLNDEGSCKKCECHENEYNCEEKCPKGIDESCQEWSQWFNDNDSQNGKTETEKKSTEELKQLGFCTEVNMTLILIK
jgi:hypothetical protein